MGLACDGPVGGTVVVVVVVAQGAATTALVFERVVDRMSVSFLVGAS